jgi:putative phosphoribosyl transferase
MERYRDRRDAGRRLARLLERFRGETGLLVLALPRGGVPVAFEVARALTAPLDIFLVRKLGVPRHEEYAMGAIASGGVRVINESVVEELGLTEPTIAAVAAREELELERREREYRGARRALPVRGRKVILVDDGLATGASMRAAALALRSLEPEKLVIAVPVGARDTCDSFGELVDEVICALCPEPFHAVGAWYDDFAQTDDGEVKRLLEAADGGQ